MPSLRPFSGHVVDAPRARTVVAPPYDALSPEQRSAMAAADPDSFLNALPPAGPESTTDLEDTLAGCRRSVDRLIAEGRFAPLGESLLAVIALGSGPDQTTAVVGDVPARAFAAEPGVDRVLPHEHVDPARVAQLVRYLEVVGVASSPVALTHRPSAGVAAETAAIVARQPRLAFRGEDGLDIALWAVDDATTQRRLTAAIEAAGTLYIADGHHRAAALLEYAARRGAGPETPSGRVLSAVVPSDQLDALSFHRRILGVPHRSAEDVVRRLRARGLEPSELAGPWQPDRAGLVALTVSGRWWSLDLRDRRTDDPVEGLDTRLAEREILTPLTEGAGEHVRVEPVAAPAGLRALEAQGAIGVALPTPGVDTILRVADAGMTMPAKTTYVTPKLRSGLLLTRR